MRKLLRVLITLLPALLLLADLLATAWALPHEGRFHLSHAVLMALAYSQVGLLAIWAALSRRRWPIRLLLPLGATTLIGLLLSRAGDVPTFGIPAGAILTTAVALLAPALIVALPLLLMRHNGLTLLAPPSADTAPKPLRFSTLHLFLLVTYVALIIGYPMLLGKARSHTFRMVGLPLISCFLYASVTLIGLWTALSRARLWIRLPILIILTPLAGLAALSIVAASSVLGLSEDATLATAVFGVLVAMLPAAALFICRFAGYRVARYTADALPSIRHEDRVKLRWVLVPLSVVLLAMSPAAYRSWRHARALDTIRSIGGRIIRLAPWITLGVDLSSNKHVNAGTLWHLGALTDMCDLNLTGTSVTDNDLKYLETLTDLDTLYLSETTVTDRGLVHLVPLRSLTFLSLAGTSVTNKGLPYLKPLAKLEYLDLSDCQISDAGLVPLKDLPSIRSLNLNHTTVTDAGLLQLRGLSNLASLSVGGTSVTEAGVEKLKKALPLLTVTGVMPFAERKALTRLQDLGAEAHVFKDRIRTVSYSGDELDAILAELTTFSALESLDLSSSALTDAHVQQLAALPLARSSLRGLSLSHTRVSDAGLAHLKNLPRLQTLDISGTRVTVKGIQQIKNARPTLNVLHNSDVRDTNVDLTDADSDAAMRIERLGGQYQIQGDKIIGVSFARRDHPGGMGQQQFLSQLNRGESAIRDADLQLLRQLPRLERLDLGGQPITDAGLEHLATLSTLRSLSLHATNVTDAGLAHLQQLSQLETLDLRYTPITDAGLEHLKSLTNLQELLLFDAPVTDAGLAHLQNLTNLRTLNLTGSHVTDAGLPHLYGLSHLETLYLARTQITDAAVRKLITALPNLDVRR